MSKKTLNKANLAALGADQLAALLMEVSTGSADIKRRLRLELSHNLGPAELAHDVRKRLVSIRKSSSFVGWRKRKALIRDLETQVAMITDKVASADPTIAFDLLWQFIDIAGSVYARVDDSSGDVGDMFRAAKNHFKDLAPRAHVDTDALADRVWAALQDNGNGEWDGILGLMAPALGPSGLARLKSHVEALAAEPLPSDRSDHEAIRFLRELRGGSTYAADRKARFIKACLQEIAAAAGDTSAYIAQYSDKDLLRKDIAAEVATLLLAEDRAGDALDTLHRAEDDPRDFGQDAWDAAYVATLTALGQVDEAQALRWARFEATLSRPHLRDHLKLMPDFDDVEAEDRAKTHVLTYPNLSTAFDFCLHWPDTLTAAQLVETRTEEINGDHYTLMTALAEALRERHPLAAVLVWRAMINWSLGQAIAPRYGHAAEHLSDCASVDPQIADYGSHPDLSTYMQTLRRQHERKVSFWAKVR